MNTETTTHSDASANPLIGLQKRKSQGDELIALGSSLVGAVVFFGLLLLGVYLIVGTAWAMIFGGNSSTDQMDGDTYGECKVVGGTWKQTGPDVVTDGYCILF